MIGGRGDLPVMMWFGLTSSYASKYLFAGLRLIWERSMFCGGDLLIEEARKSLI